MSNKGVILVQQNNILCPWYTVVKKFRNFYGRQLFYSALMPTINILDCNLVL